MIALVDCNNFFASCERAFHLRLENRPVAVLSNNDGCVIALTNEIKRAGVQRGDPYFQVREKLQRIGAEIFPANFQLYQNISDRIFRELQNHTPHVERYSIDENFLLVPHPLVMVESFAHKLRNSIYTISGVPVSIGLGRTKTLAKVASKIAKHLQNGYYIIHPTKEEQLLATVKVDSVWGIGRQTTKQLTSFGVFSARDLTRCSDHWILRTFNRRLLDLVEELRGTARLPLIAESPPRKSIMHSRTFPQAVTDIAQLGRTAAQFTAQTIQRLMAQHSRASELHLYLRTSRHHQPFYAQRTMKYLNPPTHYLPDILPLLYSSVAQIYRPGLPFRKMAVILYGIEDLESQQPEMVAMDRYSYKKKLQLQQMIYQLQRRHGAQICRPAALLRR